MKLQLRLEGPDLESGMPLHLLTDGLKSVNSIIDKAYIVNRQKARISSAERELFYIQSHGVRGGSFVADLEIVLRHAAPIVALIGTITPSLMWEQAKAAFDFLKVVFQSAQSGTMPKIEVHGNESVSVHIGGKKHIHFHGPVLNIGKAAVPYFRDLAHLLQHDPVESLRLTPISKTKAREPMVLHSEDSQLFDVPSSVDPDPIWISCDIYDFNKQTFHGKAEVGREQPIPAGKYPFKVVGEQDIDDYSRALLFPSKELLCRLEKWIDPLGKSGIRILHALEIR